MMFVLFPRIYWLYLTYHPIEEKLVCQVNIDFDNLERNTMINTKKSIAVHTGKILCSTKIMLGQICIIIYRYITIAGKYNYTIFDK